MDCGTGLGGERVVINSKYLTEGGSRSRSRGSRSSGRSRSRSREHST